MAVLVLTLGTLTTVHAQTNLQARLAARPLTRGDIAAYKLPATIQLSGGLNTVGLGQPLYLEVQVDSTIAASDIAGVTWALTSKPAGSKAELAESPLGNDVLPYEPSDKLVKQIAGRKLLVPDVAGAYVVTATVSAAGTTADLAQTYVGATYVGIAMCARCHSGMVKNMAPSWAKTAHANLFKDGVNGVASDHYAASCISCHTVGYDTATGAVNGGFDDVAAALKWIFPTTQKAGVFEAMPDELKNVANIQCENCHGPGSVHVNGGSPAAISVSFGSGDCAQCHDAPTHHIKNGEWNNSVHAVVTTHASGAGEEACVKCHTGTGFVGQLKGAKTVDTTYNPINCQTCHESHGQTSPETNAHLVRTQQVVTLADGTQITGGGSGLLCMNCHQSRQNAALYASNPTGSARFGPHHGPQADMLEGVNGFTYGEMIPSSAHWFVVEDTCVTCHMQTVAETDAAFTHAGGHTFKPSWSGNDKTPAVDLVGACQKCHGPNLKEFNFRLIDYDGDGVIDGVQTEVQHLLDQLALQLPPVGKPKSALTMDATWTAAQLQAAYNWQFVKEDGSLGVHNAAYAVGLLKASIASVSGK